MDNSFAQFILDSLYEIFVIIKTNNVKKFKKDQPLPVVGGFSEWWNALDLLVTFQLVFNQCWTTGAWMFFIGGDSAQIFWQCMYEFTYDVQWPTTISDLQEVPE